MKLSTQLKGMRKLVKDNQEIKYAARELEMLPDVPTAGSRVLVKTLPDKPGFAPKWNGPYEIIISGAPVPVLT